MNKELEDFSREATKSIKTEKDLSEFSQALTKIVIKTALNAELDEHPGYGKHDKPHSDNRRNGYTSKTLRTEGGEFELHNPHDKQGNFESHLINNRPTRFTFMDNKILGLYSKAMTTRIMIKKAIYLVLGVNMNDHKGLLDLWLSKNEGAKF